MSTPRKASPEISSLAPLATLLGFSDVDSAFQSSGALTKGPRSAEAKMALSRREAMLGTGLLAASALAQPAKAELAIDPIGAYGKLPEKRGPIKRKDGKPNTGIGLLRDCFDGVLPEDGLIKWYEEHLADDFTAEFVGGPTLDRKTYLAVTADLLKSFPDFKYVSGSAFKFADNPFTVQWSGIFVGTFSGAPFSPASGAPAVKPNKAAIESPATLNFATFEKGTEPKLSKIKKIKFTAKAGQVIGPYSLYVQAGGDAEKLPKA